MLNKTKWISKNIGDLQGKSYIITGASSGIGLECAKILLKQKAHVYFVVRNKEKTLKIIEEIKHEIPDAKADILVCDQSKRKSIEGFFTNLTLNEVDGILLNAGIYFPKEGSLGEDGTGLTFYTNVVGTYLLAEGFRKRFPKTRFVFVNSIANVSPKNHDYKTCVQKAIYKRGKEYMISKRGIMNLFGYYYLNNKDMFVTMTHPGVTATNILGNGFTPLFKRIGQAFMYLVVHKPWKGCLGEVYLLASSNVSRGDYLVPRGLFEISGYPVKRRIPKRKTFSDAENVYKTLSSIY